MADESQFTLQWDINHAIFAVATESGRAESDVFTKGGFTWVISFERRDARAMYLLRCGIAHNRLWKCDANVEGTHTGYFNGYRKGRRFCQEYSIHDLPNSSNWKDLSEKFLEDPKFKKTVMFKIDIVNVEVDEPLTDLTAPNAMSNVVLKVGQEKLHVSKEYLAFLSPVFWTLFFGESDEKGKEEVEIEDVVYEEFLDLMHVIYPGGVKLTDRMVLHILKLADRFQMKGVMAKAEAYLMSAEKFEDRLAIAEQYNLMELKDHCLQKSQEMVKKPKPSADTANYPAEMRELIEQMEL